MSTNKPRRILAAAAPKQSSGNAVAEEDSAHSDAAMSSPHTQRPKRQTVKAACNACQRRKVKCSGERPVCALCQARGQICTYDAEAGLTRIEALRRRNKELTDQNAGYETVFNALRAEPEAEAVKHLLHLRAARDIESFAESLKQDQAANPKRHRSNLNDTSLDGMDGADGVDGVDGMDGMDGAQSVSHESSYDHETDPIDHSPDPQLVTSRLQSAFVQTMGRPTSTPSQVYGADGDSQSREPGINHTSFAPHLSQNLAETWPFQSAPHRGSIIPAPPSRNLPAQERHSSGLEEQSWAMQFDASQRNFDPALVGSHTDTMITLAPIQPLDPARQTDVEVNGNGEDAQAWNHWGYWQHPSN